MSCEDKIAIAEILKEIEVNDGRMDFKEVARVREEADRRLKEAGIVLILPCQGKT